MLYKCVLFDWLTSNQPTGTLQFILMVLMLDMNANDEVVVEVVEGSLVPAMCKTGPEGHYIVSH